MELLRTERGLSGESRFVTVELNEPRKAALRGDPAELEREAAFDAGEYNIGRLANSLRLGCDCLGEITYRDAVVCDSRGDPRTIRNAICLHEEDAGLLWKQTDTRTGAVESRRSRRMVLSFIATVANYE